MAVPLTIKVFQGGQQVAQKDYDRDIIKIGRLSSAHLCIDDEKVSRIHSVIEVGPQGDLSIIDMGSVEGTFVNGRRVNKGALQFGDKVTIGSTTLQVEKASLAPTISIEAVTTEASKPEAAGAESEATAVPVPVAVPAAAPPEARANQAQAQVQVPAVSRADSVAPARPSRRKGVGPLGLELRFLWGDQMVGEFFLPPDEKRGFTIGALKGVDFEMGEAKLEGAAFVVARMSKGGATLRFTPKMHGELQRRFGDQTLTLEMARKQGLATADGDAFSLALDQEDFAWVDLGGIVLEVFYQPAPKRVLVPFFEVLDFTALNIFLVCFFLSTLFVITAANHNIEGDAFNDELNSSEARIAKLLIKPAEPNPILQKFEKKKKESGEMAQKQRGDEGQMGKKEAPKRSARAAPRGDPSNKDQARLLAKKIFGNGSGGISTIFGHSGLGGELKSAMGNMFGPAAGDAQGLAGLGLRGSGSGGGGVGDTIGIGGIGTKGRGGGTAGYGSGVGVMGGRKDIDPYITQSEPTVVGGLDKELIRKVIHANRGQIRYCFESQLNRFPKLEGKVAVKFVISASGSVASSTVAQSTVGNAEMEACVAGRVRTWVFPKPKGGGLAVVTYPFLFRPSGQ